MSKPPPPDDPHPPPEPPPRTPVHAVLYSVCDEDGHPIFTEADVRAGMLLAHENPATALEFAADLCEGNWGGPGEGWTENLLLAIALAVPERAEAIRGALGCDWREFSLRLARLKRGLPWRD